MLQIFRGELHLKNEGPRVLDVMPAKLHLVGADEAPVFEVEAGRLSLTNEVHAPPFYRVTPIVAGSVTGREDGRRKPALRSKSKPYISYGCDPNQ